MTDAVPWTIRRGVAADAPALAAFAARTFEETFAGSTTAEDMAQHLASNYSPELQGLELADPDILTLLIVQGDVLSAFSQVGRAQPPVPVDATGLMEIKRFYVDAQLRGTGAAQRLMEASRQGCRDLGGAALWLTVFEHNARAIAFYRRCQFEDVGATYYWLGGDRQNDRVMVLARA